jgi:hypothetical protein
MLLYLTGAMIGLYDMYVPHFLNQKHTGKGGSLLAAYFTIKVFNRLA